MFENFQGNAEAQRSLAGMILTGRIPQTLLLSGPEGVGKATLARRFAQRLLDHPERIEADDLSLEGNQTIIAEREKWPSEKRSSDPLMFASHPDFVTFCPDGPLRQLSIQQMRLLRERAQLRPLKGNWRVFLIDRFDRSAQQAADSLLKTLEEPPPHLILMLTAENPYDLPPTVRSRSVQIPLSPLADSEVEAFLKERGAAEIQKRVAFSAGSPGLAASLDPAQFEKRREAMLAFLETAAGSIRFGHWQKASEAMMASKSENLEQYLKPLYSLIGDVARLHSGAEVRSNKDVAGRLERIAGAVPFVWLRDALEFADSLPGLERRNVQKAPAMDAGALRLRGVL